MKHAAFLMVASLLAACNVEPKNPTDNEEKITINADESGQVAFNLPFASGSVKLPEGSLSNADFDIDGVKMVPGGSITSFNVDAGDKGGTVHFVFKAPGSAEEVRTYFLDQFKQKGLEAAAAGTSVSGKTKDGNPFTIRVEPAAQGSQGTITIQTND
jgi:hypothetical protein